MRAEVRPDRIKLKVDMAVHLRASARCVGKESAYHSRKPNYIVSREIAMNRRSESILRPSPFSANNASSSRLLRRLGRTVHESLEARLLLDASGIAGNDCIPDLELSSTATVMTLGDTLELNLLSDGIGSVDDLDENETIRLVLDPDDGPQNATLTPEGDFTWTPTSDQVGTFEFIVIAVDSGTPPLADAEVFTVEVQPIADPDSPPDLAEISDVTATIGEQLIIPISATDADSDLIAVNVDLDGAPAAVSISPSVGETAGQYDGEVRFTATEEQAGASITVTIIASSPANGDNALSDSEEFTINVSSVIAADDAFEATEDVVLNVSAATGVLSNDTDADGTPLTASVVETTTNGVLNLSNDGSFTYTPNAEFVGEDTFTYEAQGQDGDASTATVTITVSEQTVVENTAPTARADTYTTQEGVELTVNAELGVLANDTDAQNDPLDVQLVTDVENGQLSLNPNGSFTYTPNAEFSGTDFFRYEASDGELSSARTNVVIIVAAVNAAPQGIADTFEVNQNTLLEVESDRSVLLNDTDREDDTLTATVLNGPTNGTLDFDDDGTFEYSPNTDFLGADSFTYEVSDGELAGAEPVVVTIEVVNPNALEVDAAAVTGDSVGNVTTTEPFSSDPFYQFLDESLPEELILNADEHLEGNPAADVVLIEYEDYQ